MKSKDINLVKSFYQERFNHLFDNNQRKIIPLLNDKLKNITNKIESKTLFNKNGEEFYYSVDTNNALVYPKFKDGSLGQPRKLGKVINNLLGKEALDEWGRQADSLRNSDNHYIIISRSPVDILRMSDHNNWHSCMSPFDTEYESCINEAINGGFVAYVIANKDLEYAENNLQEEDLFFDKIRNVGKIEPISRLKINRYIDDKKQELALPMNKVYGEKISGFFDSVLNWIKSKQDSNIFNINFDKLKRVGGKYLDQNDKIIFNDYFGYKNHKINKNIKYFNKKINLSKKSLKIIIGYLKDGEDVPFIFKNILNNFENSKKLEGSKLLEELKNSIEDFILINGYPPDFAKEWAKNKLESGNFSEKFEIGIMKYIENIKDVPFFAENWLKNKLNSKNLSEEFTNKIINLITFCIDTNYIPDSLKSFAEFKLNSGDYPKEWEIGINCYIKKYGIALDFSKKWIKNKLESNNYPKEWLETINYFIENYGDPPSFASDFVVKKLEANNYPQKWENMILNYIEKYNVIPYFANNFIKKQLDSDNISSKLKIIINSCMEKYNYPQDFAENWVENKLKSNTHPKEWEIIIINYIEKNGLPQIFASDWTKKILESGNHPKELETGITNHIEKYGFPPVFAENWTRNKLESNDYPKKWEVIINNFIKRYGYPPDFAKNWIKQRLVKN